MNILEQGTNNAPEQTPYSVIQHNVDTITLSSAEISQLWSTYMAQSTSKCMVPFFVEKCNDTDIRSLLQFVLDVSNRHINSITEIFNKSNIPVPHGFTDEDFEVNAKPLYGDTFMLLYSRFMTKYGMINFSFARSLSIRPDIIEFFKGCLNDFNEISDRASNVALSKGLIAKTKKVKDYFSRGKQIIDKQAGVLGSLMEDEDLPKPINYDYLVTDSTESPYSDKLMMFHSTIFLAHSISGYGLALANCARTDIVSSLTRLMAELGDYVKDGLDLMIENGWLERVPEAANRRELRTTNN